ncbi:MAG: FliH/SctL family protein [Pseudomonadota bacterium]
MASAHLLKPGRLAELGATLAPGAARMPAQEVDALVRAEAIVAEAEARATTIVAEAETVRQAERERGLEEGRAAGREEMLAAVLNSQAKADRAIASLEREVAGLALDIARAVIGEAAQADVAAALTSRALREMRRERRADLRIDPALAAEMQERIAGIVDEFPEVELVDVIEDSALSGPHVVLESRVGRVDAHVDRILSEIANQLANALQARGATTGESAGGSEG